MYYYIQSRFYRAPEIILGSQAYTTAIDMWSLGCILFEFYFGAPLFASENEQQQLSMIMEYKGFPPSNLIKEATKRDLFFNPDGTHIQVTDNESKWFNIYLWNVLYRKSDESYFEIIMRDIDLRGSQLYEVH